MRVAGVDARPSKPGPYKLSGGGVGRDGYGLGAMGLGDFSHGAIFVFFMLDGRADKS